MTGSEIQVFPSIRSRWIRWLGALAGMPMGMPAVQTPPPPTPGEVAVADTLWGPGFLQGGRMPDGSSERYNPDLLVQQKGWAVYERMLRDDQITACLAIANAAVSSRTWSLEITDEAEQGAALEFVRFNLNDVLQGTVRQLLDELLTARVFGFALVEKVCGVVEWRGRSYWAHTAFKLRPAWSFTFRSDPFGNVECLVQNQQGARVELDPARFVHFVFQPEIDPHYGRSALIPAYEHWWAKHNVLKVYSNFASLMMQESGAPMPSGVWSHGGHIQTNSGFAGPGVSSFDSLNVGSLSLSGNRVRQLLQRVYVQDTTSRSSISAVYSTYTVASLAPVCSLSSILVRAAIYYQIDANATVGQIGSHLMRNPKGGANSFGYLTTSAAGAAGRPGTIGSIVGQTVQTLGGVMHFEAVDSAGNLDPKQYGVDWNREQGSGAAGVYGGTVTLEEWL